MIQLIKNIDHAKVQNLAALVDYQPGQVVSRTFAQNNALSLTLFAFAKGEGISAHTVPADAMLYVLDGAARVTIAGETHRLTAGQVVVMPAGKPHAVDADEPFKMLLVVVKAPQALQSIS